jgi:hypothetical protein
MADTYVVINKYHTRIGGPDGTHRYEVGDEIEPTEEELKAFPDRFRKKDSSQVRRGPGRSHRGDQDEPKAERESTEEEEKTGASTLPHSMPPKTVAPPSPPR